MRKLFFILGIGAFMIFSACNQRGTKDETSDVKAPIDGDNVVLKDFGPEPFVFNIEDYTLQNETFRTAVWTGKYMQMTVMTIQPGEDIGLELHPDIDQFIRVEEGSGIVLMGDTKDNLDFQRRVSDDIAIFIPAGKWHNVKNDSDKPLKLYSIYAPMEHPHGTVHLTRKEGAEAHDH